MGSPYVDFGGPKKFDGDEKEKGGKISHSPYVEVGPKKNLDVASGKKERKTAHSPYVELGPKKNSTIGGRTSPDLQDDDKRKKRSPRSGSRSVPRSKSGRKDNISASSGEDSVGENFDIAVLERDEEFRYGWFTFRPKFLQFLQNPIFVLVALCLCMISQTFGINGVYPTAAPFLQMRFFLNGIELGVIRMMYPIGHAIALLFVMYFGARANRPRWVAGGAALMAVGCLLTTTPQYFVEVHKPRRQGREGCRLNGTLSKVEEQCDDYKRAVAMKYVFMLGYLLYGAGAAPAFTMGLTYMDENVSHRKSTIFTGILTICNLLGGALGFLVTAMLIQIPGDVGKPYRNEDLVYNDKDPEYYGAWWLGMLVAMILCILSAAVVSGFPNQLRGAARARAENMRDRMRHKGRYAEADVPETGFDPSVVGSVLKSCLTLLRLPYFIGLVFDQCSLAFISTSFGTFLPTYLQTVFQLPIFHAAAYCAAFVVVAIMATLAGIFIQYAFRLTVAGNIRLAFAASLTGLLFMGSFRITCPANYLAGFEAPYPIYKETFNPKSDANITAGCNAGCGCSQDDYTPVCYTPDDPSAQEKSKHSRTIFNSCYAGCIKNESDSLSNCQCIPYGDYQTQPGGGKVTLGECDDVCSDYLKYAFSIAFSWLLVAFYIRKNAIEQSILRSIPSEIRVVGLATADAFVKLFGEIPSAPLFGAALQRSCVAWEKECENDVCAWGDEHSLSLIIVVGGYIVLSFGVIGLGVAAFTFGRYETQAKSTRSALSLERKPPDMDLEKVDVIKPKSKKAVTECRLKRKETV